MAIDFDLICNHELYIILGDFRSIRSCSLFFYLGTSFETIGSYATDSPSGNMEVFTKLNWLSKSES